MITSQQEVELLTRLNNEICKRTQAGYFAPDELKGVAAIKKLILQLKTYSENNSFKSALRSITILS